jgi:hypothetical protein
MSHDPYVGPGEFPLGSPQSRAAARMRLQQLRASRPQVDLLHSVPRPHRDNGLVHVGEWSELPDGQLMRWTYTPRAAHEESDVSEPN